MKVFIITEGGGDIGFGHITRSIALSEAFKERRIIPKFIINGDDSIRGLLKNENYQIFNCLEEKNRLFEIINNTGLVIIDSYLAEEALYTEISEITNGRIVMIDDYNRIEYPIGIIVNPSIYADKLNYPQKDGMIYLLGKKYIMLRREFWNVPEKFINKEVKNILITFGGIGINHSDLIYKIIDYLKNKFDFNLHIIEPKENKLNAEEILNLMLQADICISGGGQTTYELARVGVPTIGICFAENQRLNLEGWQDKGFIEYIGWHNDENLLKKIVDAINKFMPYEERVRRSEIGRNYIDGAGAKRIVSKLVKKSKLGAELKK